MNRGQLFLGLVLVLSGILLLVGSIFQVNVWAYCWPIGFILVGLWLILRPGLLAGKHPQELILLGDLHRKGNWTVTDSEIWLGVADIDLDFTDTEIPPGITQVKIYGFVGDVDILVPSSIGVKVNAVGFVVSSDLLGRKQDKFLNPVEVSTENYLGAEQRLKIELVGFVVDVKVKKV